MSRAEITRSSIPFAPQREAYMQDPSIIGAAQCMEPRLCPAVHLIFENKKRIIEKSLLGLCLTDSVFLRALPTVPGVPVEAFDSDPVNHNGILP